LAFALFAFAYGTARVAFATSAHPISSAIAEQPEPGTCAVETRKSAAPDRIQLGETVQVTLVVTASCVSAPPAFHIVLVVDGSGAASDVGGDLKAFLRQVVQRLSLDSHPGLRLGVVEYDEEAVARCELTEREGRVVGCIMSADFVGASRPDTGIDEAVAMLVRGHNNFGGDRADLRELILVTMAGTPATGCQTTLAAASSAKAKGIGLMSVCAGANCDSQCTRQVATSPRYAYDLDDGVEIATTVLEIYDAIPRLPRAAMVTITDTLPVNMAYVAGSASPPAQMIDSRLVWSAVPMPPDTITVTFRVQPVEAGRHATNVEAEARVSFIDHADIVRSFPVPEVEVIGPDTPTATATDTPTQTPTPSPNDRRWTLYLPDVWNAGRP
jgi:hypothetical protein